MFSMAQKIVELKSQLEEAERQLKIAIKAAEENHYRLLEKLAESEEQDRLQISECMEEVATIKRLLDQQLLNARSDLEPLTLSRGMLVHRFENGYLDYSVFKDPKMVDYAVQSYAYVFEKSGQRGTLPLAEHISHVSAMISAGWIKKPGEWSDWHYRSNLVPDKKA